MRHDELPREWDTYSPTPDQASSRCPKGVGSDPMTDTASYWFTQIDSLDTLPDNQYGSIQFQPTSVAVASPDFGGILGDVSTRDKGHRDCHRDDPARGIAMCCRLPGLGAGTREISTSKIVVFNDEKSISNRGPLYRPIAARPILDAPTRPKGIRKFTSSRQTPFCFIQESGQGDQVLLDPLPKRGRRIGPLPEQKARQAAAARKRGVCIKCKLSKRAVRL
jgi:hypothetical protein